MGSPGPGGFMDDVGPEVGKDGRGGPAIQLAQSITFRPAKRLSVDVAISFLSGCPPSVGEHRPRQEGTHHESNS